MASAANGLIKGKGLVLITGKKGSGKSHFATSQVKYIRDNFPDHLFPVSTGINRQNASNIQPCDAVPRKHGD